MCECFTFSASQPKMSIDKLLISLILCHNCQVLFIFVTLCAFGTILCVITNFKSFKKEVCLLPYYVLLDKLFSVDILNVNRR